MRVRPNTARVKHPLFDDGGRASGVRRISPSDSDDTGFVEASETRPVLGWEILLSALA